MSFRTRKPIRSESLSCPLRTISGQVGLRLKAFATHGNVHPSPTACPLQLGPQTPISPVELWRNTAESVREPPSYQDRITTMAPAGKNYIPLDRSSSPGPLATDFTSQQIAKQRNSNYHSTSLRNMVATSVNRTALHPGGVQ